MARRRLVGIGLSFGSLLILGACGAPPDPGGETAASPEPIASEPAAPPAERPADSELTSLEGGDESRIYYQFIDARGRVAFVERLEDVPESWRDRVGFVEMDSPPPLSPGDARRSREAKYGAVAAATGGAGTPHVILYFAEWCGYCHKAKRHLEKRGIPYELRDVDVPAAKQELIAKTGQKSIPVIEVDGRIMKGYSAGGLDRLLDAAKG